MSSTDYITIDFLPSAKECSPVQIRWHGGSAPYTLTISSNNATFARHFLLPHTSATWTLNATAGTTVALLVGAKAGLTGCKSFNVQRGPNQSSLHRDPEKTGLSTKVVAEIAIGAAVIALLAFVHFLWLRRRRWRSRARRRKRNIDLNESSLATTEPHRSAKTVVPQREG